MGRRDSHAKSDWTLVLSLIDAHGCQHDYRSRCRAIGGFFAK